MGSALDETKRKAALHGGWIEETIMELSAEVERLQAENAGLQVELEETRTALEYHTSGEIARDLAEACKQLRFVDTAYSTFRTRTLWALRSGAKARVALRAELEREVKPPSQEGRSAPPGETEHPALDLGAMERGDPVFPALIREIIEALEEELLEARLALGYWKDGKAAKDLAEACRQLKAADAARQHAESNYDAARADAALQTLVLYDVQRHLTECAHDDSEALKQRVATVLESDAAAPLLCLLEAARAWRDAIRNCNGIYAAEQELLKAIEGCNP